jgi:GT2 family glycosyltransferase
VDFCRRLRGAGLRIRYEPTAVFAHEGGTSLASLGAEGFARAYGANMRRYVRKHHGAAAAAIIGALAVAGGGLRRAIGLVRRQN